MNDLRNSDAKLAVDVNDPFNGRIPAGSVYRIEDFWVNVSGSSWKDAMFTNPAAHNYALRVMAAGLPTDDDVFYGKIGSLGFLIHKSELELK